MEIKFKKTKIIATVGPSITQKIWDFSIMENPENKDMVAKAYEVTQGIFDAGVNCVRMNFSHGTYEEQGVRVKIIKDICAKKNLPISMLLDTKGPEIRLCDFEGEDAIVHAGSTITIECLNKVIGNSNTFSVTDSTKTYNMAADVKVGAKILVDDGKLQLVAESVNINDGIIIAKALNSHKIKKNKRINLPGANYTMPFVSQKDKADLVFACENHFDYVAASFVNSALNVKEIRDILDANGGKDIKIIAKIESTQGIKNLKEIVQTADGIMVARGDLGLEISYYEVPYWQNLMIQWCRESAKPVIVATQMLDSMERNLIPTRAETTDVWFAGHKGADATMLSGETAQGQFPIEAVTAMATINKESELFFDYDGVDAYVEHANLSSKAKEFAHKLTSHNKMTGVGRNKQTKFEATICFGHSTDEEIIAASAFRPAAPVIFVTNNKQQLTKYGIYYGIYMFYAENGSEEETVQKILNQYSLTSEKTLIIRD